MSLVEHAKREMELAGLYDKDSDYAGMIPEAVMVLIAAHADQGHSGGSHHLALEIFNRLIRYKTLTPITSNPNEWMEVGNNTWQNLRQGSCFSLDGGQTWYDIDDPKKKNWPNQNWFKRTFVNPFK